MANRRKFTSTCEGGICGLRIWERKARTHGRKTIAARTLVKCGCCEERVDIFYGDGAIEINGVCGTVENWREILGPLLELNK